MTAPHTGAEAGELLVRAENITKGFPGVWEHLILDHISIDIRAKEIHALLGENGAGKTVLANILSGFYTASTGQIYVRGRPVAIGSPADAIRLGIGMVHQETTLVRPLTVAENVALGLKTAHAFSFPVRAVERRLRDLSRVYGLPIEPGARVQDLSVGEQQRVEILKILYYEPVVILLDEPTSVLTPAESHELFGTLRRMAQQGHGVLFITHKMEEVFGSSDRVTVLRLGKIVGHKTTTETSPSELTHLMFGTVAPETIEGRIQRPGSPALTVEDLHVRGGDGALRVRGVSLHVCAGEILGIAGVAGNGQSELVEAVTGLRVVERGKVLLFGEDVTNRSPADLQKRGLAHIPEDRRRVGVAEGMTPAENLMLRAYKEWPFSRAGFLRKAAMSKHAQELVSEYEILIPDLWQTESRILSGGNIQRIILARELSRRPKVIIASHPTYGLDLKAFRHTADFFLDLRKAGSAILLVSEDLNEVTALSDRVAVMFEGRLVGMLTREQATIERLGPLMAGSSAAPAPS
jgi:simple sugar transport system ATP-binding protein